VTRQSSGDMRRENAELRPAFGIEAGWRMARVAGVTAARRCGCLMLKPCPTGEPPSFVRRLHPEAWVSRDEMDAGGSGRRRDACQHRPGI